MRTFLLPYLLLWCGSTQAQDTHAIVASVSGTTPGTTLYIGLLDAKGEQLHGDKVAVTATTTTVALGLHPPGRYAVRTYQDENGNGRLDLGMFRIPKEGVGSSNNPKALMSAPKLDDMLFTVDGPTGVGIVLNHY